MFNGITAADGKSFAHLIIGQHGAKFRTPVHHRVAEIGDAVVHEDLFLFLLALGVPFVGREAHLLAACDVQVFRSLLCENLNEFADGTSLLGVVAVIALEHLDEGPLRPFVITRIAGAHFAAPVEAEADLVELFAITVDVILRGDFRMLSGLDGILFGGQSVRVVTHRMEHVEALQSLVSCINIRSDVSERMTYM